MGLPCNQQLNIGSSMIKEVDLNYPFYLGQCHTIFLLSWVVSWCFKGWGRYKVIYLILYVRFGRFERWILLPLHVTSWNWCLTALLPPVFLTCFPFCLCAMILIFYFFTLPATHYTCGGELYFSQLWVVCTVYSSTVFFSSLALS